MNPERGDVKIWMRAGVSTALFVFVPGILCVTTAVLISLWQARLDATIAANRVPLRRTKAIQYGGGKSLVVSGVGTLTATPTDWLGGPVVNRRDCWLELRGVPGYEIGLRADGVVVWRKKE